MPLKEKKISTKAKIADYIINHHAVSKTELSKALNLSMPTVLSNTNDLIDSKMIIESGEFESTGGRKAKRLSINPSYRYALGLTVTANHLGMTLINFKYEIEKTERIRLKFSADASYCLKAAKIVDAFLENTVDLKKILGIGISIPGIINSEQHFIIKSHALQLENYSLSFFEQAFSSFAVHFENDANAAMMAEDLNKYQNALYLSLNHTLGGAFCINGQLFPGQNQKAGEFGHMILVPGGRKCYCGKAGCADAYCAASVLTEQTSETLDSFMEKVAAHNTGVQKKWDKYLENLAILISNLRMAYDTDLILGGEVGGYLSDYMIPLGEKVIKYNGFEHDIRYLKNCSYKREASAVGAAKYFFHEFIKTLN